jgi:hypothetical protein
MGSWTELDAYYPPGALSPAAGLLVALARARGGGQGMPDRALVAGLVRRGLGCDADVLARAERYLGGVSEEQFLAELAGVLNRQQRRCLARNLVASGRERPFVAQALAALAVPPEELSGPAEDLSIFPQ